MHKKQKIAQFDPNGIGLENGHFIGLPFNETEAEIVFFPVPWDVTVSYNAGTSLGPQNILDASTQLDLYDPNVKDAWKIGHYFRPIDINYLNLNQATRPLAETYIKYLEQGKSTDTQEMKALLKQINLACEQVNNYVYENCRLLLQKKKLLALVGGDHSSPLGYLKALADIYPHFGILQVDAHLDLRNAYEHFTYSHASIFYNALQIKAITQLTSVGIRDYCDSELHLVQQEKNRIRVFYDQSIREQQYNGQSYHQICDEIIATLPKYVYLSFDVDGLNPTLCPHTGTPVPGGLNFNEALFLIKKLVESGRTLIGFDLCEVAGEYEWDANVGARLLYRISNLMWLSHQKKYPF